VEDRDQTDNNKEAIKGGFLSLGVSLDREIENERAGADRTDA
jgi:hypothetical protein